MIILGISNELRNAWIGGPRNGLQDWNQGFQDCGQTFYLEIEIRRKLQFLLENVHSLVSSESQKVRKIFRGLFACHCVKNPNFHTLPPSAARGDIGVTSALLILKNPATAQPHYKRKRQAPPERSFCHANTLCRTNIHRSRCFGRSPSPVGAIDQKFLRVCKEGN